MERKKDTITFWGNGIVSKADNRSKCHEREVCLNYSERSENVCVDGVEWVGSGMESDDNEVREEAGDQ